MPIYEYQCKKCRSITPFLERIHEKRPFWRRRKCQACGSKKLVRVFSTFVVRRSSSEADMLNDLSKMGPVQLVPRQPGFGGPPPGGCPYEKGEASETKDE